MSQNNQEYLKLDVPEEVIDELLNEQYTLVFSEKLQKKVYVLKVWIEKPLFKKYKKLFGYTDIGWTVKHPRNLTKALIYEGIFKVSE